MKMDPIVKMLIRSLHRDYYKMLDVLLTTKVKSLPSDAFMKKTV
jgi:hypothetical protein